MIYSFIILNTILFMAKFTMKTTTNSTTSIMLSLSLHPVITTKNGMKIRAFIAELFHLKEAGQKCDIQTHTQTDRHTHLLLRPLPYGRGLKKIK